MRHAKSGWDEEGVADHDRALNARGERAAPAMGQLLVDKGLIPDLVISSTALRARTTALAVVEACGWQPELRLTRKLYMAEPDQILAVVKHLPDDVTRVLLVGHNPGTEDLVSDLALVRQAMPTAAIARFDLSIRRWSDVIDEKSARLVDVWRPREMMD
jgi:phosphohistidine phosphatase